MACRQTSAYNISDKPFGLLIYLKTWLAHISTSSKKFTRYRKWSPGSAHRYVSIKI